MWEFFLTLALFILFLVPVLPTLVYLTVKMAVVGYHRGIEQVSGLGPDESINQTGGQ